MSEQTFSFAGLAPASKAEAAAAGAGVPVGGGFAPAAPAAPVEAPSAVQAAPVAASTAVVAATAPRFVGGYLRAGTVPLRCPIEHEGRVWEEIPLYRPTSAELGRYFERLAAIGPNETILFPVYAFPDGTPIPEAVFEFLDDDDREDCAEAAENFMPARLRRLRDVQSTASRPSTGANTGPISSM